MVYHPPEHTQIFTNNLWVIKSSKTSKTRKKREIALIVLQAAAHIGSPIALAHNSVTAKNITRSMSLLPKSGQDFKLLRQSIDFLAAMVMNHRIDSDYLLTTRGGVLAKAHRSMRFG